MGQLVGSEPGQLVVKIGLARSAGGVIERDRSKEVAAACLEQTATEIHYLRL